jgi:PAS domain S-box-containing protein
MLKQKSVTIGIAPPKMTVFRSPFLWLVLLIGFSTTFVVWRLSNRDIAEQTKERFDSRAEQIVTAVEQRMHAYEQVLRGGVGLFRTGPTITQHQWHEYVENVNLAQNYPGIQNFAVDFPIPAAEKNAHIAQVRAEGHPEYSITPEQPERPVYHSLVYVEPFGGRNLRAFGFDMYTNPVRREAMDRAIDLGLPSVSGMVRLAQETNVDVQHGFIYCLPVYHTGRLAVTPDQRRAALRALVCGGFRANDLMRGIFGARTSDMELEVFDGAITPETRMYNSSEHGEEIAVSTLSHTRPVEIGGRTWNLRISANQAFINSISWTQSQLVMVSGTLLSFALFLGLGFWFDIERRTQESVRRNSHIFNAVQDAVKEGLLVINKSGIVISSNPTAAQRLALSPDQLIGRSILEVMPPDIVAKRRAMGEEVIRSGRPIAFEDALKGRDYLNNLYPVFDSRNQCEAIVIVETDITERKRDQARGERLASLIEASPDFIGFADPKTTQIQYINKNGRRMCGIGENEDLGKLKISDVHPVWMNKLLTEVVVPAAVRDGLWEGEGAFLHRNGREIPVLMALLARKAANGEVDILYTVSRDISERKHMEEGLRASEQKFRGLVEQAIAGVYILQEGKISYMNPRGAEIFGQGSVEDVVGTDPLRWIVEADHSKWAEGMRRLLDGEVASVALEFGVLRRDGVIIQVGLNGVRATHEGRPALIGLLQDISQKKRAEAEIGRYAEQLRVAFMSTVEVATTLSEMRDPYTAGHERRVGRTAAAIGAELGFDERRIEGLRVAGYLHDIGKITIPAEILAKPGKLSPIEFQLMQGHPQASYDVLKDVKFPWPVAEIALQHHERMDGSGYPQGLKGEAILLEARIMAVADVIEAMSSHRPYRPGLGIDKALAEIERGRGSAYDPAVADACLRLFREKLYRLEQTSDLSAARTSATKSSQT